MPYATRSRFGGGVDGGFGTSFRKSCVGGGEDGGFGTSRFGGGEDGGFGTSLITRSPFVEAVSEGAQPDAIAMVRGVAMV